MEVQSIFDMIAEWIPKISTVIAGCALISTILPSKTPHKILQKILDIINVIALNIGKATNHDKIADGK